MIQVTRLNGSKLVINAILIEMMEATPDTVISLTTGNKIIVRESVADVISLVVDYMRHTGSFGMSVKRQGLEESE